MTNIRVTVLGGGTSAERDVSLRSAAAVSRALQTAGYTVTQADPAALTDRQLEAACRNSDVVFPALHGIGGEDGSLQEWLESFDFCFVGADSKVSHLCFNKVNYKPYLHKLGIKTPVGELVDSESVWRSPLTDEPYVLKPNDGGSSVDTFIVRDPATADKTAIAEAFSRHGHMLLEQLISGQEITVGVLNGDPLPVIEIIPPRDGEFDYDNKYNGKTQELCPPQHISSDVQAEAQELSRTIHQSLGIADFSRTDIMVRSGDSILFVLETNTIPGMTDQSLLPKAAAAAGLDMPELCASLVEAAIARRGKQA